jgi:hypothetical protein
MDIYLWSLLLGAAGLGVMALSGMGARGGHVHASGAPGHAGHGHGAAGSSAARGAGHSAARATSTVGGAASRALWSVASPRFLFSFFLGAGATGALLAPLAGALGFVRLPLAALGGVAFERFLVTPLWNVAMRFASAPALTLESAVADEATAVTAFDANGQGIISVEVDGQVQQILATLRPADRTLGARVRAGQRVRIEDVSAGTNRCTVSLL